MDKQKQPPKLPDAVIRAANLLSREFKLHKYHICSKCRKSAMLTLSDMEVDLPVKEGEEPKKEIWYYFYYLCACGQVKQTSQIKKVSSLLNRLSKDEKVLARLEEVKQPKQVKTE